MKPISKSLHDQALRIAGKRKNIPRPTTLLRYQTFRTCIRATPRQRKAKLAEAHRQNLIVLGYTAECGLRDDSKALDTFKVEGPFPVFTVTDIEVRDVLNIYPDEHAAVIRVHFTAP